MNADEVEMKMVRAGVLNSIDGLYVNDACRFDAGMLLRYMQMTGDEKECLDIVCSDFAVLLKERMNEMKMHRPEFVGVKVRLEWEDGHVSEHVIDRGNRKALEYVLERFEYTQD